MVTASITLVRTALSARFRGLRFEVDSCRKIASSESWSQHSWENALDIYPQDKRQGDQVYRFLLSGKQEGLLPIGTICWDGQGGCTTAHRDHIHVDGSPKKTGTPSCAKDNNGSSGTVPEWMDALRGIPLFGNLFVDSVNTGVRTGGDIGAVVGEAINPFSNFQGTGIPSLGIPAEAGAIERTITFFIGFALVIIGILLIAWELRDTVIGTAVKGLKNAA